MIFKKVTFIGMLFVVASSCSRPEEDAVHRDLRRESSEHGLALAAFLGDEATIVPFDGEPSQFKNRFGSLSLETFGKSGETIASVASTSDSSTRVTLETLDGKTLLNKELHLPSFLILSYDERCGRIAFVADRELRWSTLDFSDRLIERVPPAAKVAADWSPGCQQLVYERDAEIFSLDIATSVRTRLASGYEPAWSPDGKYIAFRSPLGTVTQMTTRGKVIPWALDTHAARGAVRWSPQGQYLSFVEERKHRVPFFGVSYHLLVCRVSDGGCATVREFGAGSGHTGIFHWILDYRSFVRTPQPDKR
jgi:hypothetical protein